MNELTKSLVGLTTNAALEVYSKLEKLLIKAFPIVSMAFILTAMSLTTYAATFTVTVTSNAGAGSLRQAIIDANNAPGADTIDFAANPFQTIQSNRIQISSELGITGDLTIDASNTKGVEVTSFGTSRIFNITNATVQLNNLSIFSGSVTAPANGGCIVVNGGTTTINNSIVWACNSTGNGGGIYVQSGNLIFQNSTLSINSATLSGGGLFINNVNATASFVSSTISSNTGTQSGGGVAVTNGTVNSRNSIYANINTDFAGTMNSQGYNLIKTTTGLTIAGTTTGNILNVDPLLGFADFNGGTTRTHEIGLTSPAVDAGDPALANTTDQRRARRNTDGNLNGIAGVDIGAFEKQKASFDFDAEGSSDLAITRIVSGTNLSWQGGIRVISSFQEQFNATPNGLSIQQFGLAADIPAPGDYDGDGKLDAAVYRPSDGIWYIFGSTGGFRGVRWGISTDIPVPADYDGDGKTDVAVYRSGVWYILKSTQGFTGTITLGNANDKPVPADYDGDLKADVAIFNAGTWTINRSTGGQTTAQFGLANDVAVPADYNGDGLDNLAVFRPSNGTWYIAKPTGVPAQNFDAIPFGLATDKLVPADYDGDGKVDIAVWRSNTMTGRGDWYILQSRDGYFLANFGFSTDKPTANSFIFQ